MEQNAEEIRKATGIPSAVLEHHCNVICEEGEEEKYRNLTETWDSPIIVTTAVQILNRTVFEECTIYATVLLYLMRYRHSRLNVQNFLIWR